MSVTTYPNNFHNMSFVSFVSSVSWPVKRIALISADDAKADLLHDYFTKGWYVALTCNMPDWTDSDKEKITSILDALYAENGWRPHCLVATSARYCKPNRGLYDVLLFSLKTTPEQIEEVVVMGDEAFASAIGAKHA
jgi:hypothetical protein